jgi:hypothetical protein
MTIKHTGFAFADANADTLGPLRIFIATVVAMTVAVTALEEMDEHLVAVLAVEHPLWARLRKAKNNDNVQNINKLSCCGNLQYQWQLTS